MSDYRQLKHHNKSQLGPEALAAVSRGPTYGERQRPNDVDGLDAQVEIIQVLLEDGWRIGGNRVRKGRVL